MSPHGLRQQYNTIYECTAHDMHALRCTTYYITLQYTVLHCITLYHIVLQCKSLCSIGINYTTIQYATLQHMMFGYKGRRAATCTRTYFAERDVTPPEDGPRARVATWGGQARGGRRPRPRDSALTCKPSPKWRAWRQKGHTKAPGPGHHCTKQKTSTSSWPCEPGHAVRSLPRLLRSRLPSQPMVAL